MSSGGAGETGGAGGAAGMSSGGAGGTSGTGSVGETGGTGGDPVPVPVADYAPSPNNPAECPAMAPENPVGDCLGLPVYLVCEYGDDNYWYVCTCDWYHWLCAGT